MEINLIIIFVIFLTVSIHAYISFFCSVPKSRRKTIIFVALVILLEPIAAYIISSNLPVILLAQSSLVYFLGLIIFRINYVHLIALGGIYLIIKFLTPILVVYAYRLT